MRDPSGVPAEGQSETGKQNSPTPEELEVQVRPSVIFTSHDSITKTDQLYVISAGTHGISLPGGKRRDYDTEGKIRRIYEQNRAILWQLLEHYRCTARPEWMNGLRKGTLALTALTELYEELGLVPTGKLRAQVRRNYNPDLDRDGDIGRFIAALDGMPARPEGIPLVADIRAHSLYIEMKDRKTLFCVPSFKADFIGKKEDLVAAAYRSGDQVETQFGAWIDVPGLYREEKPSMTEKGKLLLRTAPIAGHEKEVHFSVCYFAREVDEARILREVARRPSANELESRLK